MSRQPASSPQTASPTCPARRPAASTPTTRTSNPSPTASPASSSTPHPAGAGAPATDANPHQHRPRRPDQPHLTNPTTPHRPATPRQRRTERGRSPSPAGGGTTLLIEIPLEDHSSAAAPEPWRRPHHPAPDAADDVQASAEGVGWATGAVALAGGRSRGLCSCGFPPGGATPVDRGRMLPFPAAPRQTVHDLLGHTAYRHRSPSGMRPGRSYRPG